MMTIKEKKKSEKERNIDILKFRDDYVEPVRDVISKISWNFRTAAVDVSFRYLLSFLKLSLRRQLLFQ